VCGVAAGALSTPFPAAQSSELKIAGILWVPATILRAKKPRFEVAEKNFEGEKPVRYSPQTYAE
jgi:hypothetical protein